MRTDLSPRTIAEHLSSSLERLDLEHVDLCLSHGPDTQTHPLVTAPIAGPSRTSEHLRLVREALTVQFDEHSRDQIGSWFAEH